MNTFKVTYYADGPHTIVETKIEETTLTKDEMMGHSHVISVEPVEKPEIKKETKVKKK